MMSADPQLIPRIPKETARAASAVFGCSNVYILVGENLEEILKRAGFSQAEPVMPPLITFFQFLEGLTDTQAMDAVRTRTDWKFALHLSLVSVTLHEHELCQFRQTLFKDIASQRKYQSLIDQLSVFTPGRNNQTLNSLDVISAVCSLNRLHHAQQAMIQTLEVLAARFPQWLRRTALPHWYGRYNPTAPRLKLAVLLGQQKCLMGAISSDIAHLLEKVHQAGMPEMSSLNEVQALAQIWSRQFHANNCEICFDLEAERRS